MPAPSGRGIAGDSSAALRSPSMLRRPGDVMRFSTSTRSDGADDPSVTHDGRPGSSARSRLDLRASAEVAKLEAEVEQAGRGARYRTGRTAGCASGIAIARSRADGRFRSRRPTRSSAGTAIPNGWTSPPRRSAPGSGTTRRRGRRRRPRDRQLPLSGRAPEVRLARRSYWGDERSALRHRRTAARGGEGPEEVPADAPLAVRMRPRTLDEMVGQEHIVGEGSALRAAIESGRPHSAILYGPPGSGKTTLARIAARMADGAFEEESAVNAGRAEIRAVIERARERRRANGRGDGPLPRRDPPLQQGPAGRAPARGRGRPPDPDRGDHREPLLRGQLGADLPQPGLRAGAALPGAGGGAAAPRARRPRAGDRRAAADRRRGPGDAGRAQRRRRPRGALGPRARGRARPGRRGRHRRDRGRPAAAGDRLRPPGRPPLRLHLRLDQVDPRLRRRRLALLPGGDAGGRRGPSLPRPPDGDPRLRGHRQRRPDGAAGRRRRRPRGRPGRPARVRR